MYRPIETYKGEAFFFNDLQLFVNRATEDFNIPMHDHDFLEFAYIAEGSGFHHIGEDVHPAHKGELFHIPIGTSHVFRPLSADLAKHPLIVYNCVISPPLLMKLNEFSSDSKIQSFMDSFYKGTQSYFVLMDTGNAIEKLFMQLHREYSLPREGTYDYLYTLLLQLFITIYRIKEEENLQYSSPALTRNLTHFDHLLTYMEQNLFADLSLSHLAQISSWSERHLQRLFKRHTEQSFNRYLQSLRIQRSCELLKSTTYKISIISEMIGYKDIASFISVFKRNVGTTPSAYRKSIK
jgi:AraC family L-rhamnose operon transcriptional activator RhaR